MNDLSGNGAAFLRRLTFLSLGLVCVPVYAAIDKIEISDTRGSGMGGAVITTVNDAAAVNRNPAALGFMRTKDEISSDNTQLGKHNFGWNVLDIGAEVTLTGELGSHIDALAGLDFDDFEFGTLRESGKLQDLVQAAAALGSLNEKDTILVSASAESMMQIGHFGIGIRTYGQVGGWVNNVDLVRIGLGLAVSEIITELESASSAEGFTPGSYQGTLSQDQKQQIESAFNQAGVDDVVAFIDSKITALVDEGKIGQGQVDAAVDTIAEMISGAGGVNRLADNETTITGRGFGAVEVPISYGYAINENFSVGATAKLMMGLVYGTQVWVFNEDNVGFLESTLDSYNQSVNIGVDLAAMYRIKRAQFAVVGRNLNSPTFDGYDQDITLETALGTTNRTINVPDVKLDPQVTIGASFIPAKRWVLESNLDLFETGTILNNYNEQRLSFGTEVDLSVVQLRLGTYKNLAESDIGWVLTGGLGFQLWALSVDAGLALSIDDTVEFDGTEYPRTAQANIGIGMTF